MPVGCPRGEGVGGMLKLWFDWYIIKKYVLNLYWPGNFWLFCSNMATPNHPTGSKSDLADKLNKSESVLLIICLPYLFRFYRAVAYRWLVRWIFGYLGWDNSRPLPACIYETARRQWPTSNTRGYVSADSRWSQSTWLVHPPCWIYPLAGDIVLCF